MATKKVPAKPKPRLKLLTGYKVTRPDGTDFHSGTVNYAEALAAHKH